MLTKIIFTILFMIQVLLPFPAKGTADFNHAMMSSDELANVFGVTDANLIYHKYEIIKVVRNTNKTRISKRSDSKDEDKMSLNFRAFSKNFSLSMAKNMDLLSPNSIIISRSHNAGLSNMTIIEDEEWPSLDCHYLYATDNISVAFSDCHDTGLRGFISDSQSLFEIHPIPKRFKQYDPSHYLITFRDYPHKIRGHWLEKRSSNQGGAKTTIETSLFFDAAAYRTYAKYFGNNRKKILDLILTYMNGIQAVYHLPSLGKRIDFSIVYMEIMEEQPKLLRTHWGQGTNLLESFCKYQSQANALSDDDPNHWDLSLYMSGLDFWAEDNKGKQSHVMMGLAYVGGICTNDYGCVIGEVGVRDRFGKPYPSTGFVSVYIMAHEIGHSLGMHHDNFKSRCPKNGFVMSPSRGTRGETTWSQCSYQLVRNLNQKCLQDVPSHIDPQNDHTIHQDKPGLQWTPDRQCQIFLFDREAKMANKKAKKYKICHSLQCQSPHRTGIYRAGPALEGTPCSRSKACGSGKCVVQKHRPTSAGSNLGSKWSKWSSDGLGCQTGCIIYAKGVQIKHRHCSTSSTGNFCEGPSEKKHFCETELGKCALEIYPEDFASQSCKMFREKFPSLKKKISNIGRQSTHNVNRTEQACFVFCKRFKSQSWYVPKLELNDRIDVDVHMPDGTWCHNDDAKDYYCLDHQCVPITRKGRHLKIEPKVSIVQNARPDGQFKISTKMENYFTINDQDEPIGKDFTVVDSMYDYEDEEENEDKWNIDDELMPGDLDAIRKHLVP